MKATDVFSDIENSIDERKRLSQTSAVEATIMTRQLQRKNKYSITLASAAEARHLEIQALQEAPNPFAPTIKIYLRYDSFSVSSIIY
jgi:hypothetical protein